MANKATDANAPKAGASIDPKVQAVFNSALSILGSKIVVDGSHVNRQVELSIVGNGVPLPRQAWLYNTNVTTVERLNKALDMLNPEEFFVNATNEEEALQLRNEALNAASVSFSIPFDRGVKLSAGELIVAQVQEYESKATGNTELGLRFVRTSAPMALDSVRSNSRLAEYRKMLATDPMED